MIRVFPSTILAATALIAAPAVAQEQREPTFTLRTPIERIAADPEARAVLERELPGFTSHPQYPQFKSMSLETLLAMFPDAVPRERVRAVEAALRALPAPTAPAPTAPTPAPTAPAAATPTQQQPTTPGSHQ